MQRTFCLSLVLTLALSSFSGLLWAQDDSESKQMAFVYDRVKSEGELENIRTYTSIEEAMKKPDKVYKLYLTDQKLDQFPLEVFMFKNLQVLNLSDNKIKAVPAEINTLKNLTELNLADNKISELPPEIGDLQNLRTFYLAKNKLHMFPVQMRGLHRLQYIDLSFNNMLPYEIKWLQSTAPDATIRY